MQAKNALLNIFLVICVLYHKRERFYDGVKLTSILRKTGVTQVLSPPCNSLVSLVNKSISHLGVNLDESCTVLCNRFKKKVRSVLVKIRQ